MASEAPTAAKLPATRTTRTVSRAHSQPTAATGPAPRHASFSADRVLVRVAHHQTGEKPVPGEDIRNGLALFRMAMGPAETIHQGVSMLESVTIRNPLARVLSTGVVRATEAMAHLPIIRSAAFQSVFKVAGHSLPYISAGILAFDGYATVQTLKNPHATRERKWLTAGRFVFNGLAAGLSFVPKTGMILSLAPAWIAHGIELYMMKLNGEKH